MNIQTPKTSVLIIFMVIALIFMIGMLLLKSYIVKITYNEVAPKIMGKNYKQITFTEALHLLILTSVLVGSVIFVPITRK